MAKSTSKRAKVITQADLSRIASQHRKWRHSEGGDKRVGKQADFTGRTLEGLNFTRLQFDDAIFKNARIINCVFYRTSLNHADFSGAKIADSQFNTAYLRGATFAKATISDVDFLRADLGHADFTEADLRYINFTDSDLTGAKLIFADLDHANFTRADLSRVNALHAKLDKLEVVGARLTGMTFPDTVPTVEDIDGKIANAIRKGGELNMSDWHTCDTTHCRAGWAVVIAGREAKALEDKYNTATAAAMLYAKSRPNSPIPDWFAAQEDVLRELGLANYKPRCERVKAKTR